MLIDIRKLIHGDGSIAEEAGELVLTERDFPGYEIPQPVSYHVQAEPHGDAVHLSFTLQGTVKSVCARCLAPVEHILDVKVEDRIAESELQDPDTEFPFTQAGRLDIDEMIYQAIVFETPQVLLCNEDCEGLCATCGKQKSACNCNDAPAKDPRWAALYGLLQEDGE